MPVDNREIIPHNMWEISRTGLAMDMQVSESAPTSEGIRRALLDRANDYAALTGLKLGTVSDRCAGDGKFLFDVQAGKGFTVDRYQKAMDWFDANWPAGIAA